MRVTYLAVAALAIVLAITYIGHMVISPAMPVLNPLNEKLSVNLAGVAELYVTTLELISLNNYTGATNLLKALGATGAVRALATLAMLHTHEVRLASLMAELEGVYNDVISQVLAGNISGARYLAMEGLSLDSEAYGELETVVNLLTSIYPNATSRIMEAADAIEARLVSINESLINVLYSPIATNITITATPSAVVVGGSVTVMGELTMFNGTAIPNATVTILIDGSPAGSAITNASGLYVTNVTIPYIYEPVITIKALFNPPPASGYLPSEASTNVTVIYEATYIAVNYTETVLWGDQVNISGVVSGPSSRSVTVSIDGVNISTVTVNNAFNVSIPTTGLTPGNYSILIYAAPSGVYAPAKYVGPLVIYALPVNLNVSASDIVIAGLPVKVFINVSPWVAGLPITVSLGGSAIMMNLTSPNVTVTLPTSPLLGMGTHSIVVNVGRKPPVGGGYYVLEVFVVNPLEIALPAVIAVVAVILVRLGTIRLGQSTRQGVVEAPALPAIATVTMPHPAEVRAVEERIIKLAPGGKIDIPSVRDIVKALSQAIATVGARTGVRLRPSQTLREYLAAVRDRLEAREYSLLSELIDIAEYALYSPHVPTPIEVARAWELARALSQ